MAFEPLRRIIPKSISSSGIEKQVTAARILEEAQKLLERLWGNEKACYVECVSFSQGTLKMRASAMAAVQELKSNSTAFVNELNRILGSRKVEILDVRNH